MLKPDRGRIRWRAMGCRTVGSAATCVPSHPRSAVALDVDVNLVTRVRGLHDHPGAEGRFAGHGLGYPAPVAQRHSNRSATAAARNDGDTPASERLSHLN